MNGKPGFSKPAMLIHGLKPHTPGIQRLAIVDLPYDNDGDNINVARVVT